MMRDEITLVRAFGVTGSEARVLLALFDGEVLDRYRLLDAIGSSKSGRRNIDVHVCHIRRKFGKNSIRTIHSYGYEMDKELRKTLAMVLPVAMAA